MNERLIHDVAWATSRHIVEVFAGVLRKEDQRKAFAEVYQRVKAGLEVFEVQDERMRQRLKPCSN